MLQRGSGRALMVVALARAVDERRGRAGFVIGEGVVLPIHPADWSYPRAHTMQAAAFALALGLVAAVFWVMGLHALVFGARASADGGSHGGGRCVTSS